jgi:two-component system sensor histidine kinase RegB
LARGRREASANEGRVRQRSLVFIRWVAILGQVMALLVVDLALGYQLPVVPVSLIIGASAALNLYAALSHRGAVWLTEGVARAYLAFDLVQLTALLALTGGLNNPFTLLMLAPVVVSAATLSRRSTAVLSLLAVSGATALAIWHLPLPWAAPGLELPPVYLAGIWGSLVVAIVFIAAYVSSLALEARGMQAALSATQIALAREQQLSALGGLAAAAAHELGSPLGTIAVAAREMERELPPDLPADSPLREDVALLRSESQRCREILAELARQPSQDFAHPFNLLPLSALVEAALQRQSHDGLEVTATRVTDPEDAPEPETAYSPETLRGLEALIQNAIQFAQSRVELRTGWTAREASVEILDDGPGFEPTILGALGEPYVSARSAKGRALGDNMGLGIFIAERLLAHSGARVSFANRPSGGAKVVIRWQRDTLEASD